RELADDLERFREGRPIAARPVGRLERGWRWCRRNKAVAALTTAVALTLLMGLATAWALALRATERAQEEQRQRGRAVEDRAIARQALDEMSSMALNDLLGQKTELTEGHRQYLRRALELYEHFARQPEQDAATRRGVIEAYLRVGMLRFRLGEYREA